VAGLVVVAGAVVAGAVVVGAVVVVVVVVVVAGLRDVSAGKETRTLLEPCMTVQKVL